MHESRPVQELATLKVQSLSVAAIKDNDDDFNAVVDQELVQGSPTTKSNMVHSKGLFGMEQSLLLRLLIETMVVTCFDSSSWTEN